MQVFLSDVALRDSCYSCRYKSWKSGSDVTAGDFWGIEHICPEIDDDRGLCMVVPHSESVFGLVPELEQFRSFPLDELIRYNPSAISSVARPAISPLFLSMIDRGYSFGFARRVCFGKALFWRGIRFVWRKFPGLRK